MRQRGFSLIELLIGIALCSVLSLALYEVFSSQHRIYTVQDDVAEMQQNARVAVETLARTVRMAGFGKQDSWTTMTGYADTGGYGFTSLSFAMNPSSGTANLLHLVGCVDGPAATLAVAVTGNPTTITLQSGEGNLFNTTTKSNISIGGKENAKIKAINGDVLTIDTDLTAGGNQGLQSDYNIGTEVFIVKWLTYSVDGASNPPALVVNEHEGAGSQEIAQFVSGFTVTVTGKIALLTLTGETKSREGKTVTQTVTTKVMTRN
jgi:prepilin-type N-terminal cleavage/methylation domain-containing protein